MWRFRRLKRRLGIRYWIILGASSLVLGALVTFLLLVGLRVIDFSQPPATKGSSSAIRTISHSKTKKEPVAKKAKGTKGSETKSSASFSSSRSSSSFASSAASVSSSSNQQKVTAPPTSTVTSRNSYPTTTVHPPAASSEVSGGYTAEETADYEAQINAVIKQYEDQGYDVEVIQGSE